MNFKIGDVVEGSSHDRDVIGVYVGDEHGTTRMAISVQQSKLNAKDVGSLHNCGGMTEDGKGWYIPRASATLAKSYVINQILSEI